MTALDFGSCFLDEIHWAASAAVEASCQSLGGRGRPNLLPRRQQTKALLPPRAPALLEYLSAPIQPICFRPLLAE